MNPDARGKIDGTHHQQLEHESREGGVLLLPFRNGYVFVLRAANEDRRIVEPRVAHAEGPLAAVLVLRLEDDETIRSCAFGPDLEVGEPTHVCPVQARIRHERVER